MGFNVLVLVPGTVRMGGGGPFASELFKINGHLQEKEKQYKKCRFFKEK